MRDLRFQQQQYEHQLQYQIQRSSQQPEYSPRNQLETHSNPTEFRVYEDFQKQPVARNNLNHCLNNSNTSKRRSLLYELKQYENFTNNTVENSSNNLKNANSNNSYNYTNNILNYNNNYYKINNIGNYNLLKNQATLPYNQNRETPKGKFWVNKGDFGNFDDKEEKLINKMHFEANSCQRGEETMERSQLVSEPETRNNNVTIHNFTSSSNNGNSASIEGEQRRNQPSALPYRSQHFTQIIAALAVSLGPLAAGLGKGYSSPAIASLQDLDLKHADSNYTTFEVSDQAGSWISSLSLLGALFGGMFGGLAMQHGRRKVLALMSLPFSLSWILTVFAKSVETMFLTSFMGGFCCAIVSMVTQVYISEISSPDIRGFLSAIQKVAGHLGILISYLLGAYLDWRQLAMLVSVAPMMLFITVIYIPETPSFLVLKGCDEDAYRSLQWLRGPEKNVELELDTIKSNIRSTLNNNLSELGNRGANRGTSTENKYAFKTILNNIKSVLKNARLIRPVLITCGLMIFQRFTGANSFGFYAVKIFRQTFTGINPHGGAIAVGFVQLLASMLSGLLIDTVGRIPLLITSSVFMSLALASFGSYVYYEQTNKLMLEYEVNAGNSDWIPLLCVLVFTVAFSLGISPISWLLVGELFPLEYRGIGSSIATSFSYLCAFLGVKTFIDFQELLGLHGVFWLYACISCVGLFFVVTCVPETKNRDLDEMHPSFVRTLTINR